MQIHSLPAGGAFGAAEIEVSAVTSVHKAALHSQMLLYRQDEMKMTKMMKMKFKNEDSRFPSDIQ